MKLYTPRNAAALAAVVLAFCVPAALAQPGGHGYGQGPGHGAGHGPAGQKGFGIESMIASLKGALELNTSQQVMWDNAMAQSKAARDSGRSTMESVRGALKVELAKAEPDFAAVAAVTDAAHASAQALRRQVREEWLKLYATFTPAQKAVVRDAARDKMARMEAFRSRMKERLSHAH